MISGALSYRVFRETGPWAQYEAPQGVALVGVYLSYIFLRDTSPFGELFIIGN